MTTQEFTYTFLPLADNLYRVAYYILESESDARDAVQDLYVKLWNSREALVNIRNPKPWCITLLRNLCIDRIRKNRPAEQLDDTIPERAEADSRLIENEEIKQLAKAIEELPPGQRAVLKLKVFEELSDKEIAARTGMSHLNVRVSLSLARKKLRKATD